MATGDDPRSEETRAVEVETLVGESVNRKGHRGLRVPSDEVQHARGDEDLEPLPDVVGLFGENTPAPPIEASSPAARVTGDGAGFPATALSPPSTHGAIPPPVAPAGDASAMRVVRRRIRKLGGEESEARESPVIPEAPPSDEAPTSPRLSRAAADEARSAVGGSPLVVAVSRTPIPSLVRHVGDLIKPTPIPSPPVPRIEPIVGDDFAVPAVEEIEAQPADPPPPPLAARRSLPPGVEALSARDLPPRPASLPPPPFASPTDPAREADDEAVDLSIDDEPAEESLRISSPDDIVEADDETTTRGATVPPPPPPKSPTARGPAVTIMESKRRRRFWWEELFSEDYFRTVPRLDREQVRSDVDWIEQALGTEAGASILDLACGSGHHAAELALRRYDVTGVDLSAVMLARAAEAAGALGAHVHWSQTDMTQMEFEAAFDAAYCVGTSFGLFDDERNAEVARRLHRALKPHGTFLLQVLNRDHAIQRQPAMAWFEGDACVCMEDSSFNFITSRLNVKRTMIFDDGRQREIEYSVRLYSLHELGQVLHQAGFRILEVSGHPRTPGAFFGASSRELIILAQKRGAEVVEIPQPGDVTLRAPVIEG